MLEDKLKILELQAKLIDRNTELVEIYKKLVKCNKEKSLLQEQFDNLRDHINYGNLN